MQNRQVATAALTAALCAAVGLMAVAPWARAADAVPSAPATFVSAQDFQAALKTAPPNQAEFNKIVKPVILRTGRVSVDVNRRIRPEERGIVHERVTEVYQIIDGGGTLRTGGTLVAPKPMKITPSNHSIGPSQQGTDIDGGETRHVGAGDVIVIPSGTPHMFTALDGSITYYVIRIDPTR